MAISLLAMRFGLRVYQFRTVTRHGGETASVTRHVVPVFLRKLVGDDFVNPVEPVEAVLLDCSPSVTAPAAAPHLVWCLSGLTELRAAALIGDLVSDAEIQQLLTLSALKTLRLDGTRVTGAGLSCLRHLPDLRRLVLSGDRIDDEAMRAISQLQQLENLEVLSRGVTDTGIRELIALPGLRRLTLDHTMITDSGLLELQQIGSLRELSVSQTQVTDEGIEALHRVRPDLDITDD
jgi:hypothetical protein